MYPTFTLRRSAIMGIDYEGCRACEGGQKWGVFRPLAVILGSQKLEGGLKVGWVKHISEKGGLLLVEGGLKVGRYFSIFRQGWVGVRSRPIKGGLLPLHYRTRLHTDSLSDFLVCTDYRTQSRRPDYRTLTATLVIGRHRHRDIIGRRLYGLYIRKTVIGRSHYRT